MSEANWDAVPIERLPARLQRRDRCSGHEKRDQIKKTQCRRLSATEEDVASGGGCCAKARRGLGSIGRSSISAVANTCLKTGGDQLGFAPSEAWSVAEHKACEPDEAFAVIPTEGGQCEHGPCDPPS